MFRNAGKKIKGLAYVLTVLGCGAAIAAGWFVGGGDIALTVLIAVGGSLAAWLLNLLLYGFGELVDCAQRTAELPKERPVPPPHAGWVCENCGTQNLLGDAKCKNCGKS